MTDIDEIRLRTKARLSEKRFRHTVGVAEEAVRLAERWGADAKAAYAAGIIHDYAKELPLKEAVRIASDMEILPDKGLLEFPALLHGAIAAHMARCEFGVTDFDILNAVMYHTTGRRGMSKLEKIIYLADFIEPNRSFDGVNEIRTLAYENLERAVLEETDMVIKFIIDRKNPLYAGMVDARNEMLEKVKEEPL